MEMFRREGHAAEPVLSAPATPATRASRIISDIRNLFNHPSFPSETNLTDSISSSLSNSTAAIMQASGIQRRIIVRLPPSRSGKISHRGSSPIGQGALTPRGTGSTLIDDQDSVIEAQSKDIFPGPRTSGPAGGFSLDDGASSEATGDVEPSAPVKMSRKKKRRRRTRKQIAEKKKRDKLRGETGNEEQPVAAAAVSSPDTERCLSPVTAATFTSPLAAADTPHAMVTAPVTESTAALLLQNAERNWESTCPVSMREASAHDTEIFTQILSLIGRLGSSFNPDGSADQTESAKLESGEPANSGLHFDYRDHGHRHEEPPRATSRPVADWLAELQASSHPVLEPHSRGRVDGSPLIEDTAAGASHVTNQNKPPITAEGTDNEGLAYKPHPRGRADGKCLTEDTPAMATHPTNENKPPTTLGETYHDRPARLQERITEPYPRGEARASRLIEETFAGASHPANKSKPPIGETDHERPALAPRARRRLDDCGLIEDTPAVAIIPTHESKPPPPDTETDHERLARLERITSGLLGKRQQQPLSPLWERKQG
ncbi:MAG: hypothetical protein Q9173_007141 [Seirophora scorigena]